jgi:phage-related protein
MTLPFPESYNQSSNAKYSHERVTHTSNYSGIFQAGASYEKFDFVYNTGDGLFYYATEDMSYGGGAILSGSHRFTLDPDGPTVNGRESHYILDDHSETDGLGNTLKVGQTINLEGCIQNASGLYNVIDIKKNYVSSLDYDSDGTIAGSLGGSSIDLSVDGWYSSDWFVVANKENSDIAIDETEFYVPSSSSSWIFHLFWGWIYIYPEKENGQYTQSFWFWKPADNIRGDSSLRAGQGVWIYADKLALGNDKSAQNGFVYIEASHNHSISASSNLHSTQDLIGVLLVDKNGNNLREDQQDFIDSWQNLTITSAEYTSLPTNSSTRRRRGVIYTLGKNDFQQDSMIDTLGPDGWVYIYKPSDTNLYKGGFYNYNNESYYVIDKKHNLQKNSSQSRTPKDNPDLDSENRVGDGKFDRIQIQGVTDQIAINSLEEAGSHEIILTAINEDPNGSDSWVTNRFFFDADYGSNVQFQAKNRRMDYGNGYYKLFPVSTNSLKFQANLKFANRTNKEANAIIHFVENHLGQLEKDKNISYLKYSQGISGFRWDGNSTFHPYDSLSNQSKTFYCGNFNHSLNFEDSNNISLSLTNLNTSILNKGESLFTKRAPSYDSSETYQKNDIAYSEINNQYYYWYNQTGVAGKDPVIKNSEWTRASGEYTDINKEYWTREFFWLPSIGLNVNQKPRLNTVSLSSKYTQIYNDGINESLLKLNLKFNNRSDEEAYAILHFLESHLGYIPFLFSPPAPYEAPQNFVCQSWDHTYKYKNNHDITAVFEQYPFNFEAQTLTNFSTQPIVGPGELHFTDPLIFASKLGDDNINPNKVLRKKMFLENVGGETVNISSISLDTNSNDVNFSILGNVPNNPAIIVEEELSKEHYTYPIPSYDASFPHNLPFGLNGKTIRLEGYDNGIEGGEYFTEVDANGVELNEYFQRNNGDIKRITSGQSTNYSESSYFISSIFTSIRKTNKLKPGQRGYLYVVYLPSSLDIEDFLVDQNNDEILVRTLKSSATSIASWGASHWQNNGNGEGRFMPTVNGSNDYEAYVKYHADLFNYYYHQVHSASDYETNKVVLSKQNRYFSQNVIIESDTFLSPQEGQIQIYIEVNE